MSKESYIGGDYIETTGGSTKIYAAEDIENSSAMHFAQTGDADGVVYGVNEDAPKINNEEKDFPTGHWSYDYEGEQTIPGDSNHLFRTTLEKTVYFQLNVNTTVPTGTIIQFQLYDYDTGLFMDFINPDDKEFGGKEVFRSGTVREIDGKKRITIELYLENSWKKEIAEDKGPARDGCLDFYWK
ncbi:MAG: hypothetical protein ACK5MD_01175, partial [Flavobacteriales bacterium]